MRKQRIGKPRILFLDQTGELGGAQLLLADIAAQYPGMVLTFQEGAFPDLLRHANIETQTLQTDLNSFRRESSLLSALSLLGPLLRLVREIGQKAAGFDLIYTNGQKAAVAGMLAGTFNRKPVVVHLHDIMDGKHFSPFNRLIFRLCTNLLASKVIANSQACAQAFIDAGGQRRKTEIVYNGFVLDHYQQLTANSLQDLHRSLQLPQDAFVVGCFSRLARWKGQSVLINALAKLPDTVTLLLVGGALFGEEAYQAELQSLVSNLNLKQRVHFLGFRPDVAELMQVCDVIAHPSIDPEPFGRTIVEAQLLAKPVIATAHGGILEIIENEQTGTLVEPSSATSLAASIENLMNDPEKCHRLGQQARNSARKRFSIDKTIADIDAILQQIPR